MSHATTRLLLVRHGETEWNVARRFQGQRDSPLTERGHWQVARLAERLRATPISAVYSSDLPRTLATAAPLAAPHGLTVQPAPAFREVNFGAFEGHTLAEMQARHGEAVGLWTGDPVDTAPPGGETLRAFHQRVADFIHATAAAHPGETVLLVGHGGSVRAAVMETLRLDLHRFRSLRMDNASLSAIEHYGPSETLLLFNDTAHLIELDGA